MPPSFIEVLGEGLIILSGVISCLLSFALAVWGIYRFNERFFKFLIAVNFIFLLGTLLVIIG